MSRRRKPRIPARRRAEKMLIWNAHRNPVGFKFYGKAKIEGEWHHFEFSVIVERKMSRRLMYFWVRETCRKMAKQNKIPLKSYYHAYDSFWSLHSLPWIKVEKVEYDVKHTVT